jgi:predicted porin
MKKSLLALAVLTAASGAAFAQSSVTLYGKVDLGLVVDSGSSAGKSIRLSSGVTGGSRIGFKGVEDLGGGLKAAFQLETGYCADAASSTSGYCTGGGFMGRQAHGDLTGSFGAISAGKQYSLGFNNLSTIDPFGTGFAGQANNFDKSTVTNYIVDPSGIRLPNSVQYSTPSMGGVIASAEVAFGETTGNWTSGRETGAALTYAAGPAYLGATYYDVGTTAGNSSARRVYLVGGTYDFGVIKLHALAQKVTGVATLDQINVLGGVTVPIAGGSLLASVINHNDRTSANADARQYGIGYQYPLSKRTSVYAAYARISNLRGASFLVGNATDTGTGNKAANFGVVHNF